MNPINLKIFSLPVHCNIGSQGQVLKSGKDYKDHFSMPTKSDQGGSTLNKSDFYLEFLRKALLGKGKPLKKISLNSNDIPLLKDFLLQCGFSQENANSLLKELLQNNPCGEVNLFQFFNKITELGTPEKEIYSPFILEPSAIPYIESALRELGLTPKEMEYALSGARVENGGLDLGKFVTNVIKIDHKGMSLQNKAKLDHFVKAIEEVVGQYAEFKGLTPENQAKPVHNLAHQISKKLEGLGIQIPDTKKGEEQIAIRSAKQSQVPTRVKATVDRILEKVGIANEKDGAQSTLFSFSKSELSDLYSKEKLSKKGKRVEIEGLRSPSKEKGGINSKNEQQKAEFSFSSKEAKLFSDSDAGKTRTYRTGLIPTDLNDGMREFNRETIEEGSMVKSKTKIVNIPQTISSSTSPESTNTAKQNLEPVRDFLPPYLIDQVGRQISRSILLGKKVIRLQLKPAALGTLRVEMDMKDNILRLGMIAENNSAKELLLSNIHELRDALVEQGVKLDRLDVQINHNFDQSLAHSKEKQSQDHNWVSFITEGGIEDPMSGPWNMPRGGDHLLDVMA